MSMSKHPPSIVDELDMDTANTHGHGTNTHIQTYPMSSINASAGSLLVDGHSLTMTNKWSPTRAMPPPVEAPLSCLSTPASSSLASSPPSTAAPSAVHFALPSEISSVSAATPTSAFGLTLDSSSESSVGLLASARPSSLLLDTHRSEADGDTEGEDSSKSGDGFHENRLSPVKTKIAATQPAQRSHRRRSSSLSAVPNGPITARAINTHRVPLPLPLPPPPVPEKREDYLALVERVWGRALASNSLIYPSAVPSPTASQDLPLAVITRTRRASRLLASSDGASAGAGDAVGVSPRSRGEETGRSFASKSDALTARTAEDTDGLGEDEREGEDEDDEDGEGTPHTPRDSPWTAEPLALLDAKTVRYPPAATYAIGPQRPVPPSPASAHVDPLGPLSLGPRSVPMARAASETRDQCPKPSTGGVLTRFRLRSAVSSQGLSTRAASSSGSGSASGAGSLVVSPCALAVRSEDLPLPHHHAAQAVGGLEVPLIYDVDSAERMHHSSPSLMGRQNGSERAHAMPLSPTMASPSPDSTGRSFFPDLIKGRRRKDTLRSHAPASAPAPTDYGLGSPSVSVGTCSRAGEFPPAPARQTSETSSAGGGCAAMAATSQAPVAATDPVVWHQRFANEVLEQEMREQEAIAQALMDHRLEKVKKSKDGAKDKEKGTRSFGLRHMFTKSGRNLKEEVRRGQLVDKGRQQEADRTSPPLPLSHSFDNSHATSMPPLPGPVEREDARISHDTRSVWSRPSAGNASFCSSSRASTAASLLSADQRSSAAGDTSADTSFSSADTSFSSADSISYKYSVSIPTESSAMSTSYPSGEMATRKGSINSRASIVTSSSSARSANGSGSGPSDAPASASTLASLTPLGSITSFKSSGSGGSDVPSLAPIGFRGSFGSNLLEEAFKAGMAEDRDSVVALRRRSRSGSSTSQQSSMSCKPPVIMRRTSSALNGAKLLDANLPPPIQEEARPQCDAPSSDATIIAHVQASVNSEVLQPPCKDKSQVGLSTPKASEINRSAQRGANPRSPTSPKQRALTGKLASQLAMLPSLSSSLGLCLQHTAAAATTVAVAPVIVAHTVDSTASLPPEEYWRAYANGQIELNDPVTPTFVSASQDGLRIHMAAMSPNLEAIQNATSPTDLSFPPPPLRASEGGRGFETPLLLSSCEAQRFQATLAAVKAVINVRETSRRLHSILERVCGAMRLEEVKVDAVLNTSVVCLARACAGASSMDGGDVFKTKACASTVTDAFAFVGLRSTSIAGHTVLCTDNASLVIRDIEADWRFRGLPVASSARFYAGIPIRDAQGHAIAVLSLWARTARPDGLTASQQKLLSLASREAAAELEASRRSALDLKLRELDQSVREWAYAVSHPTDSVDTASLATSKPPTAPISSPSPSLAERRNVKIPSELLLPSLRSIPESLHPEFIRLQKAVDAMSQALQVETVYLASVDSDPLNATAIASSKGSSRSVACLDAPLHLCALASTSQGLRWRGDRASQLIGTTGCNSSFTIRCETEEQARSKAFGRGWVLGLVAPTFDFEAPEVVMYIQRFARLLGIVLYEEESARTSSIATLTAGQPTKERSHHLHTSPMQQQQQRRKEAYLASSKDSALFLRSPIPKVQVDRPLPSHPGRTQVGTRVLPAASPPPASPLPLPPMTLPDPPVYVSSPSLSSREHGSNTHSPPKREVQLPPGHILNGISPPRSAAPVKQGALGTCQ